jgi:hypothetical protein
LLDDFFDWLKFFLHFLDLFFGELEFLYFVLKVRDVVGLSIDTFLSEIVNFDEILL